MSQASAQIGIFYFMALFGIWQIPSLSVEIGINLFLATQTAVTGFLVPYHKIYPKLLKIHGL
jgi:hypothetical protein